MTGEVYIGQSMNIKTRWETHIRDLRNNEHHSYKLQNAWNEWGEETFDFDVVEEISFSNETNFDKAKLELLLLMRETHYINKFNTINHGYNIINSLLEVYKDQSKFPKFIFPINVKQCIKENHNLIKADHLTEQEIVNFIDATNEHLEIILETDEWGDYPLWKIHYAFADKINKRIPKGSIAPILINANVLIKIGRRNKCNPNCDLTFSQGRKMFINRNKIQEFKNIIEYPFRYVRQTDFKMNNVIYYDKKRRQDDKNME